MWVQIPPQQITFRYITVYLAGAIKCISRHISCSGMSQELHKPAQRNHISDPEVRSSSLKSFLVRNEIKWDTVRTSLFLDNRDVSFFSTCLAYHILNIFSYFTSYSFSKSISLISFVSISRNKNNNKKTHTPPTPIPPTPIPPENNLSDQQIDTTFKQLVFIAFWHL